MRKIRAFVVPALALVGKSASFSVCPLPISSKSIARSPIRNEAHLNFVNPGTTALCSLAVDADSMSDVDETGRSWKDRFKGVFKYVRPRRTLPYLFAFVLGIRVGAMRQQQLASTATSTTALAHPVRGTMRRFPALTVVLIVIAIRDTWSLVPNWAKPSILKRKSKEGDNDDVDPNDMTSIPNIATKLGDVYKAATVKLAENAMGYGEAYAALLALLVTMGQLKEREARHRDKLYEDSGKDADPQEVLLGLDEAFEFADWAYDESPFGSLKDNLLGLNFRVLKHDKNTEPGYVGHYIAVSKERKLVLVGVKGTSSLEDLLTDCCGNVVTYKLPGPFVEGGSTKIKCHEGILLSAERLADDIQPFIEDFVLPTDYNILITGHSLGAGAAALLSVILRARIPALQRGNRLRVLAFASPPVLDYDSAKACTPFITTIVNNSDIVPRMSLQNAMSMVQFLEFVDQRLEEKGMSVETWKGAKTFIELLAKGKDSEMLLTSEEIRQHAEHLVETDDVDHVYVAGKVLHMYDMWSKEIDDNADEETIKTAEKVHLADGSSLTLNMIEMDSRMVSDHLSDAYRSSLKSLLT